jgi:hypothetical protein
MVSAMIRVGRGGSRVVGVVRVVTILLVLPAGVVGGLGCASTAKRIGSTIVANLGSPITVKVTGSGSARLVLAEAGVSGTPTSQSTVSLPYQKVITDKPSGIIVGATISGVGTSSQTLTCEIDAPGRPPVVKSSSGTVPEVTCDLHI